MQSSISIPIRLEQQQQQQQTASSERKQARQPTSPPPPSRPSVMERLRELEAEMSVEAAGLRLPPDPELTEKLSAFLVAQHPNADLQITVSSVRRTTTTKQQFKTETPGMIGLPTEQLLELQRKLMQKISANDELAANGAHGEQPEAEWARRGQPDVQRSETVEESMDDAAIVGAQLITKKRVHTELMSQSRAQGLDDLPPPPPTAPSMQQQRHHDDGDDGFRSPPQYQQQQQRSSAFSSVTNGISPHQETAIPVRKA